MWTDRDRSSLRLASEYSARTAQLLLGLVSIFWVYTTLPLFRALDPLNRLVDRIVAEDYFKPGALRDVFSGLEAPPRGVVRSAGMARAAAIIKWRAANDGNVEGLDVKTQAAEAAVRTSLSQNPTDPFLWLTLFPLENIRNGFGPESLRFLAQSYQRGPLEGWVAIRRNRIALASFPMLDSALQDIVVAEFAGMVDANLTEVAAINLTGVGWAQRDRLLGGLSRVDIESRQALWKRLSAGGIKVEIPGIEYDARPWQ